MVDGVDDVLVGGEEVVGFDFLQGLGDGFLAERTSDFLQSKQLGGILILDQVDVGEAALARLRVRRGNGDVQGRAYLAQQTQQLEAPVVDLELGSAGKAAHAIGEVVEEVEEVLGHCDGWVVDEAG